MDEITEIKLAVKKLSNLIERFSETQEWNLDDDCREKLIKKKQDLGIQDNNDLISYLLVMEEKALLQ
jgi:hypothetical protein